MRRRSAAGHGRSGGLDLSFDFDENGVVALIVSQDRVPLAQTVDLRGAT